MNIYKYLLILFISISLFYGCQEDDVDAGSIVAPSNIEISVTYIDEGTESPAPGLGSGEIMLSATADNAISYHFVVQGQTKLQQSGSASHTFTTLGTNTYPVTVIAFGTGGASSSKTIEVEVQALYEPPAELLELLYGSGTKTWRIKSEAAKHFGLGAPGGSDPFAYFAVGANEKVDVGMYDDRYIFDEDGTFTHITAGTVFGREGLISEIGGPGDGTPDGADILNYTYGDYTGSWFITAPGGVETLNLTGTSFIGYYVGGNHQYQILDRKTPNQMIIKTTDGNNEFDWGFIIVAD